MPPKSYGVTDEKLVTKCANPNHGNVYEARAHKGKARLMFFYSEEEEAVIVCTNPFWKGQGNQDGAFSTCAKLKSIFEKYYDEPHKGT